MLVAIWGVVVSSWQLRNWRGSVFALAGALAILIAGMAPAPISGILQAGVWGICLFALLRADFVRVMSRIESRFVTDYVRILQDFGRLKRAARDVPPETHTARFEAHLDSLKRLNAP